MTDLLGRDFAYWKSSMTEEEYAKHLTKCDKPETECAWYSFVQRKNKKYTYTTEPVENGVSPQGHKYWNSLIVSILDENGNKIHEYKRNYSSMYKTFFPFEKDGKDYALYSKDYTATSIMELPSGKEIWTEPRNSFGFCPVEFFVPKDSPFGFLSGCIWGDDSSWKLQAIDLRDIENGNAKRIQPFGYCPLINGKSIEESIVYFEYSIDGGEEYINASVLTEYEFSYDLKEENKE